MKKTMILAAAALALHVASAGTFGAAGSGAENEVAWITGTGFIRALPQGITIIFR